MLFWITQQVILSAIFILVLHYLYTYFKVNLTQPKVKDLIHKPKKAYEEIYKTLEKTEDTNNNNSYKKNIKSNIQTSQSNSNEMEKELQSFLNKISEPKPMNNFTSNNLNTMAYSTL